MKPAALPVDRARWDALSATLLVALVISVVRAVVILWSGLSLPLIDLHSFRQTQTAVSVYWLLHGGSWLAYETPVLGAPWSVPFEFPTYQYVVALLAQADIPLDAAGRLVAFAFYVATLWPLHLLFRAVGLQRVAYLSTAVLFMTAPLYTYWSRTFSIESCALFFSCLALAQMALFLRERRVWTGAGLVTTGTVAALTKATTFPAFAFVAGCLVLLDLGSRLRRNRSVWELHHALVPGLLLLIPFFVCYAWIGYSDAVKRANEFGQMLTSAAVHDWAYGSQEQRISPQLWRDTIGGRVLPDLFGTATIVGCAAAGAAVLLPRNAVAALLATTAFLLPFLIFTNLHIVHNYYQYANGIFALAAVGIGIGCIAAGQSRVRAAVAGGLLLMVTAGQVVAFQEVFEPQVVQSTVDHSLLDAARFVRDQTPPESSILVFGDDWAAHGPYFSDRKGLAVPSFATPQQVDRILADPQAFLGDRPLGAIILCRRGLRAYRDRGDAIERFVTAHVSLGTFGRCQVFSG